MNDTRSPPSPGRATPDFVEAPLKYLASADTRVVYVASAGGGDTTRHEGNYVMQPVVIRNGRIRAGEFSLDREGFTLAAHASKVSDFYSDDQIAAVYEDEIRALVIEATGAARVEIFDHTRRAASLDVQKARLIREPASIIHNDYTARSGPKRLQDHFSGNPDEAESLLRRRFAIVNVWRSIRGTVRNAPLALCDASSVAPEDLVPVRRESRQRIGEIQQALYNPGHRWYYFPGMTVHEALLIKTYDSAEDGRARFTIHTSFNDPAAPADSPPRESVETRCFVFF
ncbi:MAG TPA: CmcJ/NvfI family oxidoreductase [Gammaproteobacteria bacterium]